MALLCRSPSLLFPDGCNCKTGASSGIEKSATPTTGKVSKHIPVDIAFSILSKLPPKSLRRFECVSKSWSMLFQNPYFTRLYRNHIIHGNHPDYDDASIIFRRTIMVDHPEHVARFEPLGRATLYFISGERFENRVELNWSLPLEVLGSDMKLIGSTSINDILCLTNIWDAESKLVLWNPITDELNVIPPSPVESVPCTKVIPFIHGIGYDRLRDDYKVIRHVEFDGRSFDFLFDRVLSMEEDLAISKEPLWEIYSLRSNSWKKFDVDMSMVMSQNEAEHIARFYMDGMCHWWDNVEKDSSDETYFVSFDMSNEVFFTTPMPSHVDDTFDLRLVKRQLVMLNGSIALISYSGETTILHISILGEIGVKESWTKLFIVGPLPHVHFPIGAGKNGDIFFENNDGQLACFNLDTHMIKEFGVDTDECQIVIYKKSLLSIRGINN
ncbi:F-box/kelch-repeat protein At3g06240-like [Trifolium pratense]|uniref:F-box/kelch-repeat protein At3g06240-like n=1 Tax=Trifolium pratense TaxID=57577 RepID=UPI001E697B7D|nr:F-box/kelch-repeat protein At3g06240-like [Trifolium pratense]